MTQPSTVAAHPFGDPQTVTVRAVDDHTVEVVWRVGMSDDLTLLGIHLEVLPEDRILLDGAITYEDGDGAAVAGSDALRDYLSDRVTVAAGDEACAGEVTDVAGDLIADGATLTFACEEAVDTATVGVRTLTDLHPAYRTLATGPHGQRAVYSSSEETHEWTLPASAAAPRPDGGQADEQSLAASAALQLGAVITAVLLVVAVGAFVLRRRNAASPPITP